MVMLRRPWVGEADGRGRGFVVVALSGPWVCCPKKKVAHPGRQSTLESAVPSLPVSHLHPKHHPCSVPARLKSPDGICNPSMVATFDICMQHVPEVLRRARELLGSRLPVS